MKKTPYSIIKNKPHLLDEPEVEELLNYAEQLQDEVIEFELQKKNSKEIVLKEMLSDILKSCNAIEKQQAEHKRFDLEPANFEVAIASLKAYIYERCKDNQIYLD